MTGTPPCSRSYFDSDLQGSDQKQKVSHGRRSQVSKRWQDARTRAHLQNHYGDFGLTVTPPCSYFA